MKIIDNLLGRNTEYRKPLPPTVVQRERSPRSRKVWRMLSAEGYEVLTPWARKEKARRRAAGKTAKQARKVSRRYRATGGLR